jgi:hypothetical protein
MLPGKEIGWWFGQVQQAMGTFEDMLWYLNLNIVPVIILNA